MTSTMTSYCSETSFSAPSQSDSKKDKNKSEPIETAKIKSCMEMGNKLFRSSSCASTFSEILKKIKVSAAVIRQAVLNWTKVSRLPLSAAPTAKKMVQPNIETVA